MPFHHFIHQTQTAVRWKHGDDGCALHRQAPTGNRKIEGVPAECADDLLAIERGERPIRGKSRLEKIREVVVRDVFRKALEKSTSERRIFVLGDGPESD